MGVTDPHPPHCPPTPLTQNYLVTLAWPGPVLLRCPFFCICFQGHLLAFALWLGPYSLVQSGSGGQCYDEWASSGKQAVTEALPAVWPQLAPHSPRMSLCVTALGSSSWRQRALCSSHGLSSGYNFIWLLIGWPVASHCLDPSFILDFFFFQEYLCEDEAISE